MIRETRPLVQISLLGLLIVLQSATLASAGWRLTFSDEFDGDQVDQGKWKFSDGLGLQTLANNGEQQCYMPENVSQSNGLLVLTARRAVTAAANCKGANSDLLYTSGRVTTTGCAWYDKSEVCKGLKAFHQAYGYFEIRAKLTKGKGFWPAFWLVAKESWPPEIDVLEALGHMPSTIVHTYHWKDAAGNYQKAGKAHDGPDFTSKFSTFAIDWQPGLIVWYIDGQETYRFSSPDVTSKIMYLQMNLAVGGHWPGSPDEQTVFPSTMEIDYVRVYERISDGAPDNVPPS